MRRVIALVVTAAAFALPSPVSAAVDCGGEETEVDTPLGLFYISVVAPEATDPVPMIFIYKESNGEPGLQRGGSAPGDVIGDECPNSNPDTYIA